MKLTVNGEERELPDGLTILALLDSLKLETERVAVEVNAVVVRRARHSAHALRAGDRVEIVTFVGGG